MLVKRGEEKGKSAKIIKAKKLSVPAEIVVGARHFTEGSESQVFKRLVSAQRPFPSQFGRSTSNTRTPTKFN